MVLKRLEKQAKDLKRKTYTLYLVYKDTRVPLWKRLFLGAVIGYAVSPLDLVPDFIPIFGYLDDLILIPLGLYFALKLIPQEIMVECEQKALNEQNQYIPLGKTAALVIIFIWIIGLFILLNWIYNLFITIL